MQWQATTSYLLFTKTFECLTNEKQPTLHGERKHAFQAFEHIIEITNQSDVVKSKQYMLSEKQTNVRPCSRFLFVSYITSRRHELKSRLP